MSKINAIIFSGLMGLMICMLQGCGVSYSLSGGSIPETSKPILLHSSRISRLL